MKFRTRFLSQILGGAFLAILCLACSGKKDYVLVIDTSGSMRFGKQVMKKIKNNASDFMERLNTGDSVTVMGFDTTTRSYGTFSIQNKADIEKPIQKIISLQARGANTDMGVMLSSLSRLQKKLETSGRQILIVIMSDGMDDPPSWKKRTPIQLASWDKGNWFSNLFKAPYIYYVSLGKLRNNKLIENLNRISPQVKELGDSPSAGLQEIGEDIDSLVNLRFFLYFLVILIIIVVLALVARRVLRKFKLRGCIEYYDTDIGPSIKSKFNLEKLDRIAFRIGRKSGVELKIRDFKAKQHLRLRTSHRKGLICLKPNKKDNELISFQKQRHKGLISQGDVFEAGNFKFEYK